MMLQLHLVNFRARHHEDDDTAALGYQKCDDLAQATGFQQIANQDR